jgi:pentapeptide MXKDX repeat protein
MRSTKMMGLVFCLMSLGALSFAGMRSQAQSDSMKSQRMKKDSMSQDSMSKDKMGHEMSKAKVLKGWVSDSECAAHGDKKCSNKEHVAQGAKLVLVTDGDNKIWTVANPETLAEHQGHHVEVKATTDGDKGTINVQEIKMLKRGK